MEFTDFSVDELVKLVQRVAAKKKFTIDRAVRIRRAEGPGFRGACLGLVSAV